MQSFLLSSVALGTLNFTMQPNHLKIFSYMLFRNAKILVLQFVSEGT